MNVLVARPDGIGDLVLSLPVATQLRQLIPGVRVGMLASAVAAPLLEHHPDVDYVRVVSVRAPMEELKRAFSGGVDAVIFLKPFRRLLWAAWRAGVPIRVATGFRWQSLLANRWTHEHRSSFTKHEAECNVEMLRGLRLTPGPVTPPRLVLTDAERAEGEQRWAGLPTPRVVVHPGGLTARRWRPDYYRDLVRDLVDAGYGVALTGTEGERIEFERDALAVQMFGSGVVDLMGRLSLRQLMAVIASAQVVVSVSTGSAHLAAAFGIPTVSLYDPRRSTHPTRWKPLGPGVLLTPDVPMCAKCIGEACGYWDCMDRMTVAQVAQHVKAVVGAHQPLTILKV